ncbi:MAG: XdhC family protein [Rhodospirillaceae bacterium]|nr:XdhC family protein [Rhodospirillaceae bacterium]
MKADLFEALKLNIAAHKACAVVTDIETGSQSFIGADTRIGDLTLKEEQLSVVNQLIVGDVSGQIDGMSLFVRVYGPSLRLIIVGAVHIAQALAPMAQLAGFKVTVIDPREAFVRAGRLSEVEALTDWPDEGMRKLQPDSRTAVVTLTHDPKLDDPALAAALRSKAFYIGSLGSNRTHAKRLARLTEDGFSERDLDRIHGPVGLDIKAETPSEIAVSILGEIVATRRRSVT